MSSGPEHERIMNTRGRGTTTSLPGKKKKKRLTLSSQSNSRNSFWFFFFSVCRLYCLRPPQPRTHDYENVNAGYGHPDHPIPPRAPTRPEAAYKGMISMLEMCRYAVCTLYCGKTFLTVIIAVFQKPSFLSQLETPGTNNLQRIQEKQKESHI